MKRQRNLPKEQEQSKNQTAMKADELQTVGSIPNLYDPEKPEEEKIEKKATPVLSDRDEEKIEDEEYAVIENPEAVYIEKRQALFTLHPNPNIRKNLIYSLYSFLVVAETEMPTDTPQKEHKATALKLARLHAWYISVKEIINSSIHEGQFSNDPSQQGVLEDDYRLLFHIDTWMQEIIKLCKGSAEVRRRRKFLIEKLLKELHLDLENLKIRSGILDAEMRKLGEAIQRELLSGADAPGALLWKAIQPVVTRPAIRGSNPLLTQESQTLLQTFLTTPKSIRDLARESNGLWSFAGVRKNLYTSLGRVWGELPQEARQGYQTPEAAIQAVVASPMKTEETRRKMRENERPGWKEEKPRQTGKANKGRSQKGITGMRGKVGEHPGGRGKKREFSDTHQTHLSSGASRRWKRERDMKQSQTDQP